jgi:RNA polymerase sigma-70 factor (ECF subfamily)
MEPPAIDPGSSDLTSDLLARARAGDESALNQLFERHLPVLRRWTHGRLPRWARDVADTTDIVQETILGTLRQLDRFQPRGDGALQAYLRQAVMNRIRNELRKLAVRGANLTLDSGMRDEGTSPLEAAIARETLDRYDAALERLKPEAREAVVSRVEFGLSYAELAEVLGKPSPDAARLTVVRALIRLAEEMNRARR